MAASSSSSSSSSSLALAALLLSALGTLAAAQPSVLFIDGSGSGYLREAHAQETTVSPAAVAATVAVLLGVSLPSEVDREVATQIGSIVAPTPFSRPRHVLTLALAGVSEDAYLEILSEHAGAQRRALSTPLGLPAQTTSERTLAATSLLHELAKIPEAAGEDVLVRSLCPVQQAESSITSSLEALVLEHSRATLDVKDGILTYNGQAFHLDKEGDRVLLLEVACLMQVFTMDSPDAAKRWTAAPELIIASLTGVQTVNEESGPSSRKANAARSLMLDVVGKSLRVLSDKLGGCLVSNVALLGDVPSQHVGTLATQLEASREVRQMLAGGVRADDIELGAAATLVNAVTAFTVGLIVLVATICSCCALFGMPVTKDTLLYSGAKLD